MSCRPGHRGWQEQRATAQSNLGRGGGSAVRLWPGFLLLALALGSLVGCGKQGPPMPPPRYIPQATTDLSIHQQGSELIFGLTYPKVTVSGLPIPGLQAVEIWEMVAPPPTSDAPLEIDARAFAQAASRLLSVRGAELTSATTGDRIAARVLLSEPLPDQPELHIFGIRSIALGGEVSDFSNRVQLVLKEPLPPPHSLKATARPDGIALTWESGSPEAVGFQIYRRQAQERGYDAPLMRVAAESREFVDTQARYGNRYIYTVRALASEDPLLESAPAGEHEIDYQDRFPPAPPQNLLALGEQSGVRLVWEASPDGDTTGYHLYRQDPGGTLRRITTDPVQALEYLDGGLASGLTYQYRASAVDNVGNEGEPGPEVSVTVR